jgi:uncharacterized membrane protein YhaH (DUF805 family)
MMEFARSLLRSADFRGRSHRRALAVYLLTALALVVVSGTVDETFGWVSPRLDTGWLTASVVLTVLVPLPALCVRRIHDLGLGAGWVLALLVPLINVAFVLVLLFKRGQVGTNRWGRDPVDAPSGLVFA